jgi:hypothetical protein
MPLRATAGVAGLMGGSNSIAKEFIKSCYAKMLSKIRVADRAKSIPSRSMPAALRRTNDQNRASQVFMFIRTYSTLSPCRA